jgi:PAS domain S-box-containing protein
MMMKTDLSVDLNQEIKRLESELIQLKNQLQSNEERYKLLFEHLTNEVHLWKLIRDANGAIKSWELIDANPSAIKVWNKEKDKIIGKNPDEIFGKGTLEQFLPKVEKIFESGTPDKWIEYFEPTDQYLSMTSIPMGEYFISTGEDISEEKRREKENAASREKLRENEEQLRHITNSIPGTIYQFRFDPEGSFSLPFISEKAQDLLGFSYSQMQDVSFLFSRILPEDFESTMLSIIEANKENAVWSHEFRALNSKDEIVWIKGYSFGNLDKSGSVAHNGVLLDITEKKEAEQALQVSEQKYRNIAENLPGIVVQYQLHPDGQDQLLFISSGIKELYEVEQTEAIKNNQLLWDKVHKDDIASYVASIQESAANLSLWEYEHRLLFPDGRTKWIYSRGTPNLQSDGSVIWDTIGIDITRQKEAEKALERLNNNLEIRVAERTEEI